MQKTGASRFEGTVKISQSSIYMRPQRAQFLQAVEDPASKGGKGRGKGSK